MTLDELKAELEIPSWTLKAIDKPDFENPGKCHDWRNHIPDAVRTHWHELSIETRLVAMAMAETQADREQWD